MSFPLRALCCLSLSLGLAACGTDVKWLLKRDGVLVAEADRVAAAAEFIDPELTTELYDAEDAKQAACRMIYESVAQLMARPPTFGEQLVSDLGMFLAYLVPLGEVERCASAQADYEAALDRLRIQMPGS
jgi:hypothetical protein